MTKKGLEDEIQYLREKLTACEKRIRELENLGNLDDIRETDLTKVIMKKSSDLINHNRSVLQENYQGGYRSLEVDTQRT